MVLIYINLNGCELTIELQYESSFDSYSSSRHEDLNHLADLAAAHWALLEVLGACRTRTHMTAIEDARVEPVGETDDARLLVIACHLGLNVLQVRLGSDSASLWRRKVFVVGG